jgi:GNAT superfamily N-acetyltransferase/catechol 2,3-dioxygenase-like lactoylglutathione lyase family enzyme
VIEGLSHVTLLTRDLDAMERFLVAAFAARKVYDSGAATFSLSKERFFLIGEGDAPVWLAVMEGEPPARSYQHVAFKIAADAFEAAQARIKAAGIEMRPGRPRVEGEARSLYFYSPDGHLFELHDGTLAERLARYRLEAPSPAPAAPTVKVRDAQPEDASDLIAMIGALAAFHGDDARATGEKLLADAFDGGRWAHFLIAEKNRDAPLGYAALTLGYQAQFARRSVDMHHLFVAPQARGQGVGKALIAASLKWARARGAARMTVGTHPDNERAARYYEGLGFARITAPSGPRFVWTFAEKGQG